jgi:hypothetical protein
MLIYYDSSVDIDYTPFYFFDYFLSLCRKMIREASKNSDRHSLLIHYWKRLGSADSQIGRNWEHCMKDSILYGYKKNMLIPYGLQQTACRLRSDSLMEMSMKIWRSVFCFMFTDVPKDSSTSVFRVQAPDSLVVTIKINVFWYSTTYTVVNVYLCFDWSCCLYLQDLKNNILRSMTSGYECLQRCEAVYCGRCLYRRFDVGVWIRCGMYLYNIQLSLLAEWVTEIQQASYFPHTHATCLSHLVLNVIILSRVWVPLDRVLDWILDLSTTFRS